MQPFRLKPKETTPRVLEWKGNTEYGVLGKGALCSLASLGTAEHVTLFGTCLETPLQLPKACFR